MADAKQWHFARNGAQGGPASESELRRMLQAGELRRTDLVWRDGMPEWQPAGQVAEFASVAPAAVPPPLPPTTAPRAPIYPGQYPPPGYARPPGPYPGMPAEDIGQNAGMRMLMPVGRSGWAIAAGYLGLLSIFPFVGALFGVAAVITGIQAIRDIKRNPSRHGMGRAIFGLVVGGLFALVWLAALVVIIADKR
jgi:hypothetical protein